MIVLTIYTLELYKPIGKTALYCFIQRILYDWHETGRYHGKRSADPNDWKCKLWPCKAKMEDQQHILHG